MIKFALLADRRSGTTLMIDCLNNLPRVHCEKRVFGLDKRIANPTKDHQSGLFFLYRTETWPRRLRYLTGRRAMIRDYLDERIFVPEGDRDVRGFRLIYDKADQHPEILDGLRGRDVRVIHLVRENVLKTFISFKTAPLHKMHHPREGDAIRTVKLRLDPASLVAELRQRARRIERMRNAAAGFVTLEVVYESFVRDRQAEAARIQPFLGLDEVLPFRSDLVKINPDRFDDLVENHQEIRRVLAGTEFERFIDG